MVLEVVVMNEPLARQAESHSRTLVNMAWTLWLEVYAQEAEPKTTRYQWGTVASHCQIETDPGAFEH